MGLSSCIHLLTKSSSFTASLAKHSIIPKTIILKPTLRATMITNTSAWRKPLSAGSPASSIPITLMYPILTTRLTAFYYTIGDDLMSVDYFRPLLSSSDGIQPLEDVLATLQIAEGAGSASSSASSNGGSAAIQDAYGEGMYKIGADLPAGEYVLLPASEFSAYYEVNSSPPGNWRTLSTTIILTAAAISPWRMDSI